MKFLDWSAEFKIGIGAIDADHQMLFNAIKELGEQISKGRGPGRISATINSLLLYVDEHFEREERFLRRANYPEYSAHKKEHDLFRDSIFSLRDYHKNNPNDIDAQKVVKFLEDWLLNHILKVDRAYAPYLLGHKKADIHTPDHQSDLKVELSCPTHKQGSVEHFIKLISEGSEEANLIEAAVEKITQIQKNRRELQAKKIFGR